MSGGAQPKRHGRTIAIVGATGAVGREMLRILEERQFPMDDLLLFASPRSQGKTFSCQGKNYSCQTLQKGCFEGVQFAFFDASDEISREWASEAAESGAFVIDNSSTFRMDPGIPLIVPEINGDLVQGKRLVAGPNCTTVQLVMALKPLHDRFGLKRVVVSTYQSVSGAGMAAMEELSLQTRAALDARTHPARALKHRIAFNCIPHIGSFDEKGYTSEENKVVAETRKILGLPDLAVSCTAVRVPTLSCHAEAVNLEFEKPVTADEARRALQEFPGVTVIDDPRENAYPLNVTWAGDKVPGGMGKDPVFVGRIREDLSCRNGLQLWIVSDNLRKGAALNAIQIAERVLATQ